MAGDWITMRMDLHGDPAVILIANACGVDEDSVVGKLHRLWSWASYQLADGHARGVTEKWVDAHVGVTGFARAMAEANWLVIKTDGKTTSISFPKWDTWLSNSAKARQLANRRKKIERDSDGTKMSRSDRDKKDRGVSVSVSVSDPLLSFQEEGSGEKPKAPVVSIPAALDTPDFRAAWDEWLAYRRERKLGKPTGMTIKATYRRFEADMGPERAAAAIRHSIEKGWQSINEPKEFTNGNRAAGSGRNGAVADRAAKEAREYPRSTAPIPIFRPGSVAATPVESGGTAKAR